MNKLRQSQIQQLVRLAKSTEFYVEQLSPKTSFKYMLQDGVILRVSLGRVVYCTCNKRQIHCIHTLHALLKIFMVDPQSPLVMQDSYNDNDIQQMFKIQQRSTNQQQAQQVNIPPDQPQPKLDQLCAICYEQFDANTLVSCQEKCKNSFHLACFYQWGKSQRQLNRISCPCCRNVWNRQEWTKISDRMDAEIQKRLVHHEQCTICKAQTIRGKIYRCATCPRTHFCNRCYHSNKMHNNSHRVFLQRDATDEQWQPNIQQDQWWDSLTDTQLPYGCQAPLSQDCSSCNKTTRCKKIICGHVICKDCLNDSIPYACLCPLDLQPMFQGYFNTIPVELQNTYKQQLNPEIYKQSEPKQDQVNQIGFVEQQFITSATCIRARTAMQHNQIKAQGFQKYRVRKVHLKFIIKK